MAVVEKDLSTLSLRAYDQRRMMGDGGSSG